MARWCNSAARATLALAILARSAGADAPRVDWARGLVIADATGVAERHAPSPAVARGTSRRGAEEAAKRLLAGKIAELPLASGGKVGERAKTAVETAIVLAAEPETDGAWRVTMTVPIEAVRQAIAGPRALDAAGDTGPQVVIVEGMKGKPAVGALAAPTLWVEKVPAWAKDAPKVSAKGLTPSAQTLYIVITR